MPTSQGRTDKSKNALKNIKSFHVIKSFKLMLNFFSETGAVVSYCSFELLKLAEEKLLFKVKGEFGHEGF